MKIQKNNFILDVNVENFFPITNFTAKKRENSFISLLGIDGNSGKILDKEIEHIFIERMKLKE